MKVTDPTYLVLIPSYNPGSLLVSTVKSAFDKCSNVWVIDDGSTDNSIQQVESAFSTSSGFRVIKKASNGGKGSAVLLGAKEAILSGFTHVVLMDADGQHNASDIPEFISRSKENPSSLIMGKPVFDANAPIARVLGRKLTIFWTDLETGFVGLGDTLFGFRVYPLFNLVKCLEKRRWAQGFDFDPEIAVRMCWAGCRPISIESKVRYIPRQEGGVSHFNYLSDNFLLICLHFRLVPEMIVFKLPTVLKNKFKWLRVKE